MKKIMFNDRFGLTKAVLEGRKTQTRRIVPQYVIQKAVDYQKEYYNGALEKIDLVTALDQLYFVERRLESPYMPGETVAIAQSYKDAGYDSDKIFYRYIKEVDGYKKELASEQKGWNNKMFVASDLMKHHIAIERVRVERLQDISEEDCLKEGICYIENPPASFNGFNYRIWPVGVKPYKRSYNNIMFFASARYAYARLIDMISGKDTWNNNPFVFVYDFKLLD